MPNFYFGKFEEVILIPLTVEIYFAIQHSQFSLEISAFLCCLCNYICKCLGYLVFSEKTGGPVSQLLSVHSSARRTHTHCSKRVEQGVPDVVAGLHLSCGQGFIMGPQ